MKSLPNTDSLIRRVATRLRVSAIARTFYKAFLWIGGIFLVALLVSRLTGYIPASWFQWPAIFAIPVLAGVVALIFHKRPSSSDSARCIDQHSNTKDLFLTFSRLQGAAGGYQALVQTDAEKRAEKIEPAGVVPFTWHRRIVPVSVTIALVALALVFMPQLDPFGQVEAAEAKAKVATVLEQSKKATVARAEQLKKDEEDEGAASEAEKEIKKLTDALKKMKPGKVTKKSQEKVLVKRKSAINRQFSEKNTKQLREMLSKKISDQSLGGMNSSEKAKEWLKELQEGKSDQLISEITSLQKEMKALAEEKDPVEKAKKARELKKKMQDLANFASDKANSKQLAQALERAMEQMEAGKENAELSKEAMEAAMESLELSKMETENLAQAAKDLKKLEEALNAIQMARQLNDEERLDGSEMEGVDSIEDYAELYAEMMGEGAGDGNGDGGGGGEGQGEGGPPAPEDDSTETDFKKEESKQQLQAGKNLLSWKTKGMSEAGEFKKQIGDSLQNVKQGVSEAIRKEQVPPGYVDGIKKYFDNIEDTMGDSKPASAPAKSGSTSKPAAAPASSGEKKE